MLIISPEPWNDHIMLNTYHVLPVCTHDARVTKMNRIHRCNMAEFAPFWLEFEITNYLRDWTETDVLAGTIFHVQ